MGMRVPKKNFWSWKFKILPKIQRICPPLASGVSSQTDAWWTLVHKQKRYSAHTDPPEVLVHCKLTQVHIPRGSTIESDTVFGVICQLPLLREEFGIATLTFHSDLRRRAASRRALPCPSSWNSFKNSSTRSTNNSISSLCIVTGRPFRFVSVSSSLPASSPKWTRPSTIMKDNYLWK